MRCFYGVYLYTQQSCFYNMVMNTAVTIIGGGAAGIGVGAVLKKMDIPFVILERETIGHSFKKWPSGTRFISPSFTGNFFGLPDLNAITPDTSPSYSLRTEHPTGAEYAAYLEAVAKHADVPVETRVEVKNIYKKDDLFHVETSGEKYTSPYLIWAGGEYSFPNNKPFEGAEHCIHNSEVESFDDIDGEVCMVIGAYESGMDAACQLAALGKKVVVLDAADELENHASDSSYCLSPFTRDRFAAHKERIRVVPHAKVSLVTKDEAGYNIHTSEGSAFKSDTQPVLATGFLFESPVIQGMFNTEDDYPLLTEHDESTVTDGLFLVGPKVKHGKALFCFIYKYRQRFAVVASVIAKRLSKEEKAHEVIREYKKAHFYIDDLSCCDAECTC